MHRAILPISIGVGSGGYLTWSWFRRWFAHRASLPLVELASSELVDLGIESLAVVDWGLVYQLGGALIAWEFRKEIWSLAASTVIFVLLVIAYLHLALGFLC